MTAVTFDALDYCADRTFAPARYRIEGEEQRGWRVFRDGTRVLELGPGFRLLRTRECGVCSTDLARHFLPFPLPQVTGHEVIACDADGRRYVVEINASHVARGMSDGCAFCRDGLPTHCPQRLVLGIHDLPGGFGPWILAPIAACLEVPAAIPDSAAVLVEPLAAALNAASTATPRPGDRVAVLGPRRLGLLLVAALAAARARMRAAGSDFAIVALGRDPTLLPRAREFGATAAHAIDGDGGKLADASFDVVFDTTGNPDALSLAVRLARREVHLKSTHGRPSCGLARLTELVVDELALERLPDAMPAPDRAPWQRLRTGARPRVAWLAPQAPPAWLTEHAEVRRGDAAALAAHYDQATEGLPRADVAVASAAEIDAAIRPRAGREEALIRPRGSVLLHPATPTSSPLVAAIARRGLRLSSSRCGDFRVALAALAGDAELRRIGERLITHRFAAADLPRAFAVAQSRACIKAVVTHAGR